MSQSVDATMHRIRCLVHVPMQPQDIGWSVHMPIKMARELTSKLNEPYNPTLHQSVFPTTTATTMALKYGHTKIQFTVEIHLPSSQLQVFQKWMISHKDS